MILFAIVSVGLRLSIVKTTYQVGQTNKMIQNAKLEKEKASVRLSKLRSPRQLEAIAKSKYHLEPPKAEQVVYLK